MSLHFKCPVEGAAMISEMNVCIGSDMQNGHAYGKNISTTKMLCCNVDRMKCSICLVYF